MFEKLFKYPRVLTRHREGPGADARELFLTHRYNEGAARNTLTRTASELLLIAKYIDVTTDKPVSTDDLEVAAGRWVRHQQRRRNVHGSRWSRMLFLQIATPWLRFLGLLREPERVSLPFVDMISDFSDYMRGERGLSEVTIRNRCWHVGKFLSGLARKNRALGEVSVRDVDEFLASKGSNDWGRVSVATSSRVLRSFFRHAEIRGWCVSGIAASIEGPRVFKQEALPIGPPWAAVQRLIGSASSDRPRDIRDQAILMLFAIYGFRSGEVAGLRLEHLNWEREVIAVVRPK
jgi:integrase